MMDLKEETEKLKHLRADGNINNLTYQYYNTAMQLANVKTMKHNLMKSHKQDSILADDLDTTNKMPHRRIKLSMKHYNIAGNSTSLKYPEENSTNTQSKLMPAVILEPTDKNIDDENEYIQLPVGLHSKRVDNHRVVKEETHLLTPGKIPKVKIVSSKSINKNKISKPTNKTALKERDLNTMKKNINMRDMLTVKTRYDVSPVNKGDFLADLKPYSRTK